MKDHNDPLGIKVLIIYDGINDNTAAARTVRGIKNELEAKDVKVEVSESCGDAKAILSTDPAIQCVLLRLSRRNDEDYRNTIEVLKVLREHNRELPVFLLAGRTDASEVPTEILENVNDFIWVLEDTPDFIGGRILAAADRYRRVILPPMFSALADFSKVHEYSWHTPGHTGGTGFLRSPAGRAFFNFFREPIFRSDLSISVGALGSLLDHSGPIGESERYTARVFGADRTYHVTNGTSTSNRVVLMASVTRNQIALCDRNCHKSVEHAITMSGAIPTYMVPTRNRYGIIGPITPDRMTPDAVRQAIADNPLVKDGMDTTPVHAIITNSTYDGLCYNVNKVKELLGQSVDRLHFDEAWYGYARFNPMYKGRFAMCCDPKDDDRKGPTMFATQSTHKLLAAFSQASMIHIREGRNPIDHQRFNEAFMMQASTSPFYPIIASNDISAAMMDGPGSRALTDVSIREAVSFRRTLARLNAEFSGKKDWFFKAWQPDFAIDKDSGKKIPFFEVAEEDLATDPEYWVLRPNEEWHGFGDVEPGFCMLDPIKVSIVTPGVGPDGKLEEQGLPAAVVSAYLDNKGIIVEKTTDFTILFLFSLGVTNGKWGTLLNALFEFKTDYDDNAPLSRVLPGLVNQYGDTYRDMGLKDLADKMFAAMKELGTTQALASAFSVLPHPDMTPVEAYENLVHNNVVSLNLDEIAGKTLATGVVPYPPGIPLMMPGENAGPADGPLLGYLKALQSFDRSFPGFGHDTHGVEVKDGTYYILCIKS